MCEKAGSRGQPRNRECDLACVSYHNFQAGCIAGYVSNNHPVTKVLLGIFPHHWFYLILRFDLRLNSPSCWL